METQSKRVVANVRDLAPMFLKQVETLFREGTASGLSDGDLLERFLHGPEDMAECAFTALVERHGPMVQRVCRRIIGDSQEAEDASQAAFLVLARKAGSIRQVNSVAGWLYGVAYRTSARAKARLVRSRRRERRGGELLARLIDGRTEPPDYSELYEELGRLPERFRLPIVLCDLEGLSYERVAEQLCCPVRTVQSRLARGRARLRDRLVRRGIAPAMAAMFCDSESEANALLVSWSQATVEAALEFAEHGTNAATVLMPTVELAYGVIKAMKFANLRILVGIGTLLLTALGLGAIAAFRAPIPADAPSDTYRASFKSGVTVEVVGVSTVPTGPDTWWKPDGSPLSEAPVDRIESRLSGPEGRGARVILLRASGLKTDDTFRWLPTRYVGYSGGQPSKNGQPAKGLEYYESTFALDRSECEVAARLAAGAWVTAASDAGLGGVGLVRNGQKFDFGKARPYAANGRSGTAIAVGHNISGKDKRLVAVDQTGTLHVGVHSIAPSGEGNCLLDAEFDMPPDSIKEFQVQYRPFEQLLIPGIRLRRREVQAPPTETGSRRHEPVRAADAKVLTQAGGGADADSDGDGLSDFQEIHKYRTDPGKFSTARDGVSDGDWQRRREFTYTIRSIVKVMPPVNPDCLNDDYQDARVLSQNDHFVELEVVHYPLNTNAEAIGGNPNWRRDASAMMAYLRPASQPTGTPRCSAILSQHFGPTASPLFDSTTRNSSPEPRPGYWQSLKL